MPRAPILPPEATPRLRFVALGGLLLLYYTDSKAFAKYFKICPQHFVEESSQAQKLNLRLVSVM